MYQNVKAKAHLSNKPYVKGKTLNHKQHSIVTIICFPKSLKFLFIAVLLCQCVGVGVCLRERVRERERERERESTRYKYIQGNREF